MFNVSLDNKLLIALSIPATYATAFGFVFAAGRVMISMAMSGLFPPLLKRTWGKYKTPYTSILIGSLFGYALVIAVYFFPIINLYLFNICILSATQAYIAQFLGYILYVVQFAGKSPGFKNPFGIIGAVYGIVVFIVCAVGLIGFQDDNYIAIISFICLAAIYTIYYYLYASRKQTFSPEEKVVFFQLHIIKCKI